MLFFQGIQVFQFKCLILYIKQYITYINYKII